MYARGLEIVAGHQAAADHAGIRLQQALPVDDRLLDREVTAEAGALRAHPGLVQVVEGALGGTSPLLLVGRLAEILRGADVRMLVEVVLTQVVAQLTKLLELQDQ